MLKKLHVGVAKTVDHGNGLVSAFCLFTLADVFGQERTWKAILHFDFGTATVKLDMGDDGNGGLVQADEEQLDAMRRCLVDLGANVGELHDYDNGDVKFSTN